MNSAQPQLLGLLQLFRMRVRNVYGVLRIKPFDLSSAEGRSQERYRRIAATTFSSFLARGIGMVTVLISVPLTLRYLGKERFGLWMTVSSITAMWSFADLGIGNGLMNAIAAAEGKEDKDAAQLATSSSFFVLLLIALIILSLLALFFHMIPWPDLFKVQSQLAKSEAGYAAAILVVSLALSMPLGIAQRVHLGFQEGFTSSLWQMLGSIFTFTGIMIAAYFHAGVAWLVLASSGGLTLAMLVNWIVHFGWLRPWLRPRFKYFSWPVARAIVGAGLIFAALQGLAFLGFTSDNLIIAQFYGSSSVAGYAVVSRLFAAVFFLQFITMPLWPASGEAVARGDYAWARRMFERAMRLCLVLGVLIALGFMLLGKIFIARWAGPAMVPSFILLLGFAAWIMVASFYAPIAAVLSSAPFLRDQLKIYGCAAISAFLLKITFAYFWGVPGVIWGAVLGYGLFAWKAWGTVRLRLQPG